MGKEKRNTAEAMPLTTAAKIRQEKDLCKVFSYFQYKVGTSLDAAIDLGIFRNSITWYIDELEKLGELQAICRKADRTTGFMAKHYSADRRLWKRKIPQELDLFNNEPCTIQDIAHAPVIDARSGEVNIMAMYKQRKEAQNGK